MPEHSRKEVKFFTNFLRTSKIKNFKKSLLTLTNDLNSSTEKKNFGPNLEKKPPFYFNPEVAHT